MAETKFQIGIVKFCIECGAEFVNKQPETETDGNVIQCGDGETSGCGKKFIAKVVD